MILRGHSQAVPASQLPWRLLALFASGVYMLLVADMYFTARYFHDAPELAMSLLLGYPFLLGAAQLGYLSDSAMKALLR